MLVASRASRDGGDKLAATAPVLASIHQNRQPWRAGRDGGRWGALQSAASQSVMLHAGQLAMLVQLLAVALTDPAVGSEGPTCWLATEEALTANQLLAH